MVDVSNENIGKSAPLHPYTDRSWMCDRLMQHESVLTQTGNVFVHFEPRTARPRRERSDRGLQSNLHPKYIIERLHTPTGHLTRPMHPPSDAF